MLAGTIFDLDGTLGNTLPVCFEAFRTVFRSFLGTEYTDTEIRAMFGPTEEGILGGRIPHDGSGAVEAYLQAYRDLHHMAPKPFTGIREVLDDLERRGVPAAVVTGKGARSAAISLEAWGLADRFTHVAAGGDGGNIKDRNMARVLADWAVDPGSVVSVGDAPSDILAARSLGIVPVAAAWATTTDATELAALDPAMLFTTVGAFAAWLGDR